MPGEIFKSPDYSLDHVIDISIKEEDKTIEKEVTLPGLDHPITIKIHTPLNTSNAQVDDALSQSMDAITGLASKLNLSSESNLELKLTVTKPNQADARISVVFAKVSEAGRKFALKEDQVAAIGQAVISQGDLAIQRAKESGKKVLVNTDHPDVQLVATKSGAIYAKVSVLGTGQFKETGLFALVRESNRVKQETVAAVGVPKASSLPADSPERKRLEREYQNELNLNQDLTELRKQAKNNKQPDPLTHVATSKIVTNPAGIALMGAAYNGGDVNKRLQANTLRPIEKALICADFLTGTAQLHTAGVIHRDIKADNILLETEERLVPKDQWPPGLASDNVPPGYSVELEHGQIKSVRQKVIIKAVLCDLGKGTNVDPAKRFFNATLYNEVMPPGRYTRADRLYSTELDVYSAGRTAYQIFAGIPIQNLTGIARSTSAERKLITDQLLDIQKQIKETKDEIKIANLKEQLETLDQQLVEWDVKSLGPPENWINWNTIPPKVQDYIKLMVDADPSKRPSAAEAASFFRSLTPEDLPSPQPSPPQPPNESAGYSGYKAEAYRAIGYTSEEGEA